MNERSWADELRARLGEDAVLVKDEGVHVFVDGEPFAIVEDEAHQILQRMRMENEFSAILLAGRKTGLGDLAGGGS